MLRTLTCSAAVLSLTLFAERPTMAPAQQMGMTNVQWQAIVKHVSHSTVFIKTTDQDDEVFTGSGFVYDATNHCVITNAHVVGMLQAKNKPPKKVEVYVDHGEPTEMRYDCKIVAVDRGSDLAVLKVDGKLPAPLGLAGDLYQTQKCWVFGFPLWSLTGKTVNASETTVTAIRRDAGTGEWNRVQCQGGMQPGNSGGPVVNALGRVVGVSVAIIRGTEISFAIPAIKVKSLMDGRLNEIKTGEIFRTGGEARLPWECDCLDPLKRIREVRLDVWAGKPATRRPASSKSQPGDEKRYSYSLKVENERASTEVLLPPLKDGQVAWIQPVIIYNKAEPPRYTIPKSFDVKMAVERVPASFVAKLPDKQERTTHLKTGFNVGDGKDVYFGISAELDVLERLTASQRGVTIPTTYSSLSLMQQLLEQKKRVPESAELPKSSPVLFVDFNNQIRRTIHPDFNAKKQPQQQENGGIPTGLWLALIAIGHEVGYFAMPNKEMKPQETWAARIPTHLFSTNPKKQSINELQMAVTCTYQGMREREGNREALVTFEGRVQSPNGKKETVDWGPVTGKLMFDSAKGFITWAQLTLVPDVSDHDDVSIEVEMTRSEGNTKKIEMAKVNPALVKEAQTLSISDIRPLLKNVATIKVDGEKFVPIKEAKLGAKQIFGDVPEWLQERKFHFIGPKAGYTQFTVESDGVVVMAVSPRFRNGASSGPTSGVFGNIKEPWYFDCKSSHDLRTEGWQPAGTLPILNMAWPAYYRECKSGEGFRIRTEKEYAPIIIQ